MAAVRAALAAAWRRWWARAVLVGLTPPFLPAAPATAMHSTAGPVAVADGAGADGLLNQAVCELLRLAEVILRLPRAECPQVSLAAGLDGWAWRIAPAHVAWAVLAALVLWWAARRDWARTADSATARVGWEAAKAAGLAYAIKLAASAMVGMAREMAPAVEMLR